MKRTKGMIKTFSILWLGLSLIPFTSNASQLEEAIQAFHANQYPKAYQLMLPLAEKGNSEAQFYLGGMLVDGLGVKADPSEGVYWLEQAASNKHAMAAKTLGDMYLSGHGVVINADKAAHYITLFDKNVNREDVDVECD